MSDDHKVALRSCMPRPEKCCDGAAVTVSPVFGNRCDSHQSSSMMRSGRTPHASRCAPTPSDVTNGTSPWRVRGWSDSRGGRSGRATRSPGRPAASREGDTGTGWKRLGPANRDGDARGPQTGSVSTRRPSISTSTVEWPSQVARSPLAGGFVHVSSGFIDGSGPRGTRRSPPQRNSLSVGIDAFGSRKPGMIGCTLPNRSPVQRGEALMRSSRAPSGFLPSDLTLPSPTSSDPERGEETLDKVGLLCST